MWGEGWVRSAGSGPLTSSEKLLKKLLLWRVQVTCLILQGKRQDAQMLGRCLTWAVVATPASSRQSSLFLHLVGKRGRNSYFMPKSLCILRSIAILETMVASVRHNQRGNRNSQMLCSALTNIAAFCVTGQVPLPLFSHLCKVSNNTDQSPDTVEN